MPDETPSDRPFIARGFRGRRPQAPSRLPPGQYEERGFPVLSAGPTPHTPREKWSFTISSPSGSQARWTWDELMALPRESPTVDIHCVTKWSKFDTRWEGVSVDVLMALAAAQGVRGAGAAATGASGAAAPGTGAPVSGFVLAICDGGYTTNLPLADVTMGKAWIAFGYDGAPLDPEHGGPARLLVPHLYFWKSAKWIRGLQLLERDHPGFWEANGYHDRGDPWREQRYQGDP